MEINAGILNGDDNNNNDNEDDEDEDTTASQNSVKKIGMLQARMISHHARSSWRRVPLPPATGILYP
jgi:hypothetical protein